MIDKFLKYYVIDVFTDKKYSGNPLAVVVIKEDLALTDYKNIAREFGYSETSFIQISEKKNTVFVRSFTPTGFEINGAGHNLLGAVHAVLFCVDNFKMNLKNIPKIVMRDKTIPLLVESTNLSLLQQTAEIRNEIPSKLISESINIAEEEVFLKNLRPTVVKTEVAHLMVPISNVNVLNNASPKKELLKALADQFGFQGVYCFSFDRNIEEISVRTRFFNPGIGIAEDPATGSAAGPLAGFLFHGGFLKKNKVYKFLQGETMGRRSIINCKIVTDGIFIGGTSVKIMEGIISI